jgi:hypothetical protein
MPKELDYLLLEDTVDNKNTNVNSKDKVTSSKHTDPKTNANSGN